MPQQEQQQEQRLPFCASLKPAMPFVPFGHPLGAMFPTGFVQECIVYALWASLRRDVYAPLGIP
jgi:hypothetical protein